MLTAQKMAELLNEALKTDPAVISQLFSLSRVCSKKLADHPHIVVSSSSRDDMFYVRLLGLLNGMLSYSGSKDVLVAMLDNDKDQNVIGFFAENSQRYDEKAKELCSCGTDCQSGNGNCNCGK